MTRPRLSARIGPMDLETHTVGVQPCAVKTCSKCKQTKPLSEFPKDRTKLDGHYSQCSECNTDRIRRRARENPERLRENNRRYDAAHREERREASRLRAREHPEVGRMWREANIEKVREVSRVQCRKWRARNPEKVKAHNLLNAAVASGKINRPPYCTRCFTPCTPDGHHEDYSEPYKVLWVCALCHRRIHFPLD